MSCWLLKSEPETFGIDDLAARPSGIEPWDGVRNYEARNRLRDQMQVGDKAFFYHSNCPEPGIVGLMTIVRAGYLDDTAFNSVSRYFDPSSDPAHPRWYRVDVCFERKLRRLIPLSELKTHPELANLPLLRKGNRLSVMPVSETEWDFILSLE
jgi:predicted RNA-binding protein with PUA-like domain